MYSMEYLSMNSILFSRRTAHSRCVERKMGCSSKRVLFCGKERTKFEREYDRAFSMTDKPVSPQNLMGKLNRRCSVSNYRVSHQRDEVSLGAQPLQREGMQISSYSTPPSESTSRDTPVVTRDVPSGGSFQVMFTRLSLREGTCTVLF